MNSLTVINPHNQMKVGKINITTADEVAMSVKNAREAFLGWSNTPIEERAGHIKQFAEKLGERADELARLISLETGKPITESIHEVHDEIDFIEYYANEGVDALSDKVLNEVDGIVYKEVFEPYGVVAAIAPWNFPISLASSGVTPSLLAGNTVVFKPSELSSLSSRMFIDLFNETGLPDGVLTMVVGDGSVGQVLTDQDIDMIWFTGSTAVGQSLYKKAADKFIHAHLELGGSSPGIVFADSDIDSAVESIYFGRFFNCGQVCSAIKRVFVHESIHDEFVKKLVSYVQTQKIGDPMNEDTVIGPMVSKKQLDNLISQVTRSLEMGAKVEVGANRLLDDQYKDGNYYAPTILTNVTFDMPVMNEEVFGPVLPIMKFSTEEEAIEYANMTEYGLTAEIYIGDISRGNEIARKIHAGSVGVNTGDFFKPWCPFGGMKKSGIGREYGIHGICEFAQYKTVVIKS